MHVWSLVLAAAAASAVLLSCALLIRLFLGAAGPPAAGEAGNMCCAMCWPKMPAAAGLWLRQRVLLLPEGLQGMCCML